MLYRLILLFQFPALFVTAMSLFVGCQSNRQEEVDATPVVEIDLKKTLQMSTLSILENSTFIQPELTEKSGLDQIEKLAVEDEKIILVNHLRKSKSKSLIAFSMNGDFLWERSSHEDGPGKFSGYTDFIIGREGNIKLLDGLRRTVLTFDLDGNYLSSQQLQTDAQRIALFPNGSYVIHRNNTYQFGSTISEHNVEFLNKTGQKKEGSFLSIPDYMRDMKLSGELFFPRQGGDSFFCTNPPSDKIYNCSNENVSPLFSLNYPERINKVNFLDRLREDPTFSANRDAYNMAFLEFLNDPEVVITYDLIAESENYYFLTFRKGMTRFIVRIEKEGLLATTYTFDDGLLDQTHVFLLDENTMAFTITNPYFLKSYIESHDSELHDKWFADFDEEEPNPVILVFKLADFEEIASTAISK